MPRMTLDEIADRLEIVDLHHRYAIALDSKDWRLLTTCFTEDGVADYRAFGGVQAGATTIAQFCREALSGLDASHHFIGNTTVELRGDEAGAGCYFVAQHVLVSDNGGNTFLVGGVYEDELIRTADGWRIRRRTLIPKWREGNPNVFAEAAERLARPAG